MPRRLAALAAACLLAPAAATNEAGTKFLAEKAKEPGVVSLPSGLMYKVLREGEGGHHPTADSSCSCHYGGTLIDGAQPCPPGPAAPSPLPPPLPPDCRCGWGGAGLAAAPCHHCHHPASG